MFLVRAFFIIFTCFCAFVEQGEAQSPVISFGNGGDVELLANSGVQSFELNVVGAGNQGFTGFELWLQIGDGGAIFDGADSAPTISNVDLITGSVFDTSPNQTTVQATPLATIFSVRDSLQVDSDGLVATVFIDTTGFNVGDQIPIRFENAGGDPLNSTNFVDATGQQFFVMGTSGRLIAVASSVKGDVNMDGDVDFIDIQPFIEALAAGVFQPEADTNCDLLVDFLDIAPFIAILADQ